MTEDDQDEYARAAMAARDAVVSSYGTVGQPRRAGPEAERAVSLALVRLLEVEIRVDGARRPGAYLPRPPHLPDDEELVPIVNSRLAKDRSLRHDALEWREICRRVEYARTSALIILCDGAAQAEALVESSTDDAERDDVGGMLDALRTHAGRYFGVDPLDAPRDRAGREAWCREKMGTGNPVPDWLADYRPTAFRRPVKFTEGFTGRSEHEHAARGEPPPERGEDE
jgi:hypothetical protein